MYTTHNAPSTHTHTLHTTHTHTTPTLHPLHTHTTGRQLFEEDHPLEIMLDGSCAHRNSKLVLRDNTYSTIQWDAFALPELIRILHQEEEIYIKKVTLQ